jgi:hypothetical protein
MPLSGLPLAWLNTYVGSARICQHAALQRSTQKGILVDSDRLALSYQRNHARCRRALRALRGPSPVSSYSFDGTSWASTTHITQHQDFLSIIALLRASRRSPTPLERSPEAPAANLILEEI